MTNKPIVLNIDGAVGVGKSTLLGILEKEGFVPFPEPVHNNPLLDKFYHDKPRYSFPLQIFFLNKRFEHIKQVLGVNKAVLDRSIYGDIVFAKMLRDSGFMSEEEFQIYKELLDNMLQHCTPPTLMIYLEVSVDEAVRRIQKRGRDYELITERQYWEDLNRNYREFFDGYKHSPLLTINVDNLDFEKNPKDRQFVLETIQNKLIEIA